MAPSPDGIDRLPDSPAPSRRWRGAEMLKGGKGYVSAPLGQLHYREQGPRDSPLPLLLLHQSPQFIAEFGAVQNSLALRQTRSVAVDMPGYGMSDPPEGLPSIGGFADNLVALLDRLQLPRVVAAGHHTGACIAAALAVRHPGRVAGLILHGCPLYTDAEAEAARGKSEWDRTPAADGSHVSQVFRWRGVGDAPEWFNRTWMAVGMFLQGVDLGHWAVNRYRMADDLAQVRVPALILSEPDDVTHEMDQRARRLRPDFLYRELRWPGSSAIMARPEEWAALALEFRQSIAAATRDG